MCVSFVTGLVSVERLLECIHEEADDRFFSHANHVIKIINYDHKVLLLHLLTQIQLYPHYIISVNSSSLIWKLWFVTGRGNSRTFFPIHDLATDLDSDLVEVLPAIHALTRCDTANKVGIKSRAVRERADYYHLLYVYQVRKSST